MSAVKLPTREWVGLLTDIALTSGSDPDVPHLATVLLDCDRGEVAVPVSSNGTGPLVDVDTTDLLIATSTDDQSMAAQAHTACMGRLHKPVLIHVVDVKALIKVFKDLVGSGKTTTRQVQLEISGDFLVVSEDPAQAPEGISVTVPILDTEEYPRSSVTVMLQQPDRSAPVLVDGEPVEPSYGTGYGYGHMEIFGKIGKRRKMTVSFYQHHQRRRVVVEIGSRYHAAFKPCPLDGEGQYDGPQVPVFVPRLPVKGEDVRPLTAVR